MPPKETEEGVRRDRVNAVNDPRESENKNTHTHTRGNTQKNRGRAREKERAVSSLLLLPLCVTLVLRSPCSLQWIGVLWKRRWSP